MALLENLLQLVTLGRARKQRHPLEHFRDDAARAPDVHRAVVRLAEQHFRGPVPQRHHHRRQLHLEVVRFGEPEVGQLEPALGRNQEILRFQIAVDNAVRVQKVYTGQQLPGEALKVVI